MSFNRLQKIKEKASILNIILNRSISHYHRIKQILQYPLITTSSLLVVLNSYYEDDEDKMKLINVILNGTNVVIMAILNNINISCKIENFNSKIQELIEIIHIIDNALFNNDYSRTEDLIEKFDLICRGVIVDAIPSHIKNKVRKEYPYVSFPLILGGSISPPPSEVYVEEG
jgi:hypothetical protein